MNPLIRFSIQMSFDPLTRERWTVLYRGVTAESRLAGSSEIKSNLVNGSLCLILDITAEPINGVLCRKPLNRSEIYGQKGQRRQFVKMRDGRSLRGCVLVGVVGCEVQAGWLQY